MDKAWNLWRSEPAVLIGVLRAVLVAAVGFGLNLSGQQITGLVLAAEAILTMLTRTAVYAPATVTALKVANATKVLEAAQGLVVTDLPIVVAESLNPVAEQLGVPDDLTPDEQQT